VKHDPSTMSSSTDPLAADALPWHAQSVVPALVPGACLSRELLYRFAGAMRAQGMTVQIQRMRYDRLYAHERLCRAHGHGCDHLRALALHLFDLYHDWQE
jgi:hypothetical protein